MDMRRWVFTVALLAFLGLAALEVIASHDAHPVQLSYSDFKILVE
jgi:hypothetical protein